MRALIIGAALVGLLLVAAGAAGGHSLVPLEMTSRWQTAFMYGYVHALGALIAAILPFRGWLHQAGGWAFLLGVPLFSGVQIGKIMLGGIAMTPTPLDGLTMLVPFGGAAFIIGWLMIGLAAAMAQRPEDEEDA
jgi:uncharacterized membrane protein YgdD (TMEM256/DUF423 family)